MAPPLRAGHAQTTAVMKDELAPPLQPQQVARTAWTRPMRGRGGAVPTVTERELSPGSNDREVGSTNVAKDEGVGTTPAAATGGVDGPGPAWQRNRAQAALTKERLAAGLLSWAAANAVTMVCSAAADCLVAATAMRAFHHNSNCGIHREKQGRRHLHGQRGSSGSDHHSDISG